MVLNKIEGSTPVKEFPNIHNTNVDTLVNEINRLNQLIEQKDTEIRELKESFNSALNRLRAEYISMIDQLKNNEDNQ